MKKGTKKHFADHENFNILQLFRSEMKDIYDVENVKWCGHWNGLNWERISFYCSDKTFSELQSNKPYGITFN